MMMSLPPQGRARGRSTRRADNLGRSCRKAGAGKSPSRYGHSLVKSWDFGQFTLQLERRSLLRDGKVVALGSRTFAILARLVESAGEIVAKQDLIAAAWGDITVDEANLRVHIAALRKSLGESHDVRFISNIPSRGYTFVAPVNKTSVAYEPKPDSEPRPRTNGHLPESVKRIFGRDLDIGRIASLLSEQRCVTIVGAGGVGKTTASLAVARRFSEGLRDGGRLIELGAVAHPELVTSALASALGVSVPTTSPLDVLVGVLADMEVLLVVDNCEHLIDAVADFVQRVLYATKGVKILATSREPLRVEGECVYRLPSLELPASATTLREALTSPAVALLVERAATVSDVLDLDDSDVPTLAEICRRLDGIPLALELAASLVSMFGVHGVSTHLDDRFALLTRGLRTALPRQRTLRATFDWSYALLAPEEQAFFRRISELRGVMTIDDAAFVAGVPRSAISTLSALVDKSLVTVEVGEEPEFRLLESTRAYAGELLAALPEEKAIVQRRHAERFTRIFTDAESSWQTDATVVPRRLTRAIDDVRAALDWAFGPSGDPAIGIQLTIATGPLWSHLSLDGEGRLRSETALARLDAVGHTLSVEQVLRARMKLHADLATSITGAGASRATESIGAIVGDHYLQTLALAEQIDDVEYKLRALWGIWVGCYLTSRHREGARRATMFLREAARLADESTASSGERMLAVSLHILGEQARAREHMDRFLERTPPAQARRSSRFAFDQRVTGLAYHARILLILGNIDQAKAILQQAMNEAARLEHMPTKLYTLVCAGCPIPLLLRDHASARQAVESLHRLAVSRESYRTWAGAFEGVLLIREGEPERGARKLRMALAEGNIPDAALAPNRSFFAAALVEAALAVKAADANALADDALRFAHELEELWFIPELMRLKAEALAQRGEDPAPTRQAGLALAREQGAAFWLTR